MKRVALDTLEKVIIGRNIKQWQSTGLLIYSCNIYQGLAMHQTEEYIKDPVYDKPRNPEKYVLLKVTAIKKSKKSLSVKHEEMSM